MKIKRCLPVFMIMILALAFFPVYGIAEEDDLKNSVLIITDVSGSMQDNMEVYQEEGDNKDHKLPKVLALKKLLLEIISELPSGCDTGIYRMRYLSGNRNVYEIFLPLNSYGSQEMTDKIKDEFITEYPVFNRRTPLADMLRQMDENEFGNIKGKITVLLISDGRESFYDLEKDMQDKEITQDDKIKGPYMEIRRLKEKYGQNLILHTLFMGKSNIRDEEENNVNNEILMQYMADAGEGKFFPAAKLFEDNSLIKELASLLCPQVQPEKEIQPVIHEIKTPPPPPPVTVKAEPVETPGISDEDEDGVEDSKDRCPGTPRLADVDESGCWVLGGFLFDTAKWNLKSEAYYELDKIVTVLEKNSDLKIEIQGHTDNAGSRAYNQRLSERRAGEVMKYLLERGVNPARISSAGYGFTMPAASNSTPEGRAMNRRVELKPVW